MDDSASSRLRCTLNMARSLSRRSGRFFRGSSLVVCSSSFQSLVWRQIVRIPFKKKHEMTLFTAYCCVELRPPVQECAPRNPSGRCRHPQLARSPWRGLLAERSSCTPGTVWLSSRTGVSGPCSKKQQNVKRQHLFSTQPLMYISAGSSDIHSRFKFLHDQSCS